MRDLRCRLCLPVILAVTGVAAAHAQQETPRFTAGVELARLDIEVTDAQGRPLRDLRADEVEVIEGGVRRPVALLQHVRAPAGSYADAARRTVGGDVSTNRGAPRGRLYVFVFDQSHITPRNEQAARRAAARFLRTRIRPGDRVALHGLPGPGARVGFTGDVARTIAALPNLTGTRDPLHFTSVGPMREFEAYEIGRGNQEILRQVLQRVATERGPAAGFTALDIHDAARSVVSRADFQARRFLDTFADLIRELRLVEGRKEVILVSEGFYDDNVGRDLERVAAAAAQSYSAVHALDINRRESDIEAFAPRGGQRFTAIQSRVSPLGTLAAETNGELFVQAAPRLDAVLDRIGGRSEDYYVLGFESAAGEDDDPDAYRRVTVRVTREGARVTTRTGYAMLGDNPAARGRRQAIDAALSAPFAFQGLRVDYTTYVLRGNRPGLADVIVSLQTELPVASARAGGAADVVFVVRDARTGRAVASGTDIIALPAVPAPGSAAGLGSYQVQFEAPPGVYLMRVVIREPGGQLGSADRRFAVGTLDGPGVSAGDLLLGPPDDRFPVRATAFTEDGLSGMLELYGATGMIDAADIELTLISIGGDDTATRIRTGAIEIGRAANGTSRIARLELPLVGLPAGRYVAQVGIELDGAPVQLTRREVDIVTGSRSRRAPDPAAAVPASEILRGELAARYLNALAPAAGNRRQAAALARAQQDDWQGAERLVAAPERAPAAETGIVELALGGLARFARQDHAGAAEALEAAFGADDDATRRALTAFFLGWIHAYRNDDRQAASAWRRAVFLDPALVPAHLALADAYVRLSQPALAAQVLRAGLTALPDSPELAERLSRLAR